jgi:hypothetical protein
VVVATALLGLAAPANAAGTTITPDQESQVRATLTKFEVPAAQQDSLIAKLNDGESWDVYTSTGPTTTESEMIGDMSYTITRYEDGSFKAMGLEKPQLASTMANSVTPFSITRCTYSLGSGYENATGCQIDGVWGTVVIGAINVGYTLVNGAPDQFTSPGSGYQHCTVVTCSTPSRVYYQKTEGTSDAEVRWQSDVTNSLVLPSSWNVWVELEVGHDTATEHTS